MVSWIDALAGWESREKQYRRPKKQSGHFEMEHDRINADDFNKLVVNFEEEV